MNFVNETDLTHTTEVELADGRIANTFHLDFLRFDDRTQDWVVMAEGTFSTLKDFRATLAKSREIALEGDAAIFEETDLTLKTSRGGYVIRFSFEPGKEESIAAAVAAAAERRAAMMARIAERRAEAAAA